MKIRGGLLWSPLSVFPKTPIPIIQILCYVLHCLLLQQICAVILIILSSFAVRCQNDYRAYRAFLHKPMTSLYIEKLLLLDTMNGYVVLVVNGEGQRERE